MYFDHVRCPSCGASFDPERIESREGVMSCPHCKSQLQLKSLFGLADAFEEMDEEEAALSRAVDRRTAAGADEPQTRGPHQPEHLRTVRDVQVCALRQTVRDALAGA